jgi:hypothetical protein
MLCARYAPRSACPGSSAAGQVDGGVFHGREKLHARHTLGNSGGHPAMEAIYGCGLSGARGRRRRRCRRGVPHQPPNTPWYRCRVSDIRNDQPRRNRRSVRLRTVYHGHPNRPADDDASCRPAQCHPGGGTQNCQYSTDDGDQIASVAVTGAICTTVTPELAANGSYWWPVDYLSQASVLADGATRACALAMDSMTMTVYDETTNAPSQTTAGVADGICQREEMNGWTPTG